MPNVCIIGAGISGLVCARKLIAAGINVSVLEKSRSLAGRCASRRFDDAVIDTGVQYFTAKDPDFLNDLKSVPALDLGVIDKPILDAAGHPIETTAARYYHPNGNNRLGKTLSDGVNIKLEHPVAALRFQNQSCFVDEEPFDAVVSSAPWPQSATLLGCEASEIYEPCLTAGFSYDGEPAGLAAEIYGMQSDGYVSWSACENAKISRVPAGRTVIVAQAGPDFSAEFFEQEPEVWAQQIRTAVEPMWHLDSGSFRAQFTHRWKFSRRHAAAVDTADLPKGFFLTGDSTTQSRVEDVWLAGLKTADDVIAWLAQRPA